MIARIASTRLWWWATGLGLLALLVRFPLLLGEHGFTPGGDSEWYFGAAASIASGDGFPGHFWTPGYPLFIAAAGVLPGRDPDVVTAIQHLLGAGLAVAVLFASRRWFGMPAAVIASALSAVAPALVIHQHALLPDFLFGLFVFAGALLLAEACARGGDAPRMLIAAGFVFGVATWVKPAGQFLFVAAPLPLLFASRDPRRALRGSALVAIALLLTITPWLVRNATQRDYYGMAIQSGSTLFNRAFEVSALPTPADAPHRRLAGQVRAEVALDPSRRYHHAFHRALVDRAGLGDAEALREQQQMALDAIWAHPAAYAGDSVPLLGRSLQDITRLEGEGRGAVQAELAEVSFPGGLASRLLDLAQVLVAGWWIVCLHGFAALLVLVTGDRRRRAAGAALLSVWTAIGLGTVLAHGGLWRYSMQLAPLTLILASAGERSWWPAWRQACALSPDELGADDLDEVRTRREARGTLRAKITA